MEQSLVEKSEQEIATLSPGLKALWYAAHGNWSKAHQLVQDESTTECAWIHAYLHRVEGDIGNAHFWYRQAGKQPGTHLTLEQELEELIGTLTIHSKK